MVINGLVVAAVTLAMSEIVAAHNAASAASPAPQEVEDPQPQSASEEDMQVFAPYIGRFRSEPQRRPSDGAAYHFTVEYSWYDQPQTIVAYKLAMVVPGEEAVTSIGEGFYYFDRVSEHIAVVGVFRDGRSGAGLIGEFDRETHERTVWVTGTAPGQPPVALRDGFELLDEDRWRNVTQVRPPGSNEWRTVSDSVYTRLTGP